MVDLTPVVRLEYYLDAIVNDGTVSFYPVTRLEMMLDDILNGRTVALTPITRVEMYLANIGGQNIAIPVPITRIEMYLAKIAGMEIEVPDPITRIEMWLAEWAEHGGGGGTITTITGVSPLALVNAVAGAISRLVQKGKAVQNGTPTPSAPVDIVCNNGALRMVHRSGLPSGYKLLEYVGGNGSRNVLTDVYLASTDVVECEFKNSTTTGYGAMYGVFKLGESSALYANQTYYGYDADNNKVDTGIRVDTEWHSSRHDFVNGTLTIDDTTVTFAPFEFENSVKNAVLSRYYNNNYGYSWKGYVRKFKVTRNGEVVCDLLPAKNSNDVAGLYDLVTGNFYEGTDGDLLEGNEVDDYELRVVGTPEVLSVVSQTASVQNLFAVGDYADTQNIISGAVTRKVGVKVFDGTEEWAAHSVAGTYRYRIEGKKVEKSPFTSTHFVYSSKASSDISYGEMMCGAASANACFRNTDCATLADFTAWLAAQYAAGTPVIVIYPLADEATESVTPQPLSTAEGTNTVNVVSDVAPVELEVDYLANA